MPHVKKRNLNKSAVYSIAVRREQVSPLMEHATWISAMFILSFIMLQMV